MDLIEEKRPQIARAGAAAVALAHQAGVTAFYEDPAKEGAVFADPPSGQDKRVEQSTHHAA